MLSRVHHRSIYGRDPYNTVILSHSRSGRSIRPFNIEERASQQRDIMSSHISARRNDRWSSGNSSIHCKANQREVETPSPDQRPKAPITKYCIPETSGRKPASLHCTGDVSSRLLLRHNDLLQYRDDVMGALIAIGSSSGEYEPCAWEATNGELSYMVLRLSGHE